MKQRSASKLTYAQKAAQSADANIKANAKANEWNLVIKKTLVKVTRNIISRKKIDSHFEKWELNFTSDENAQCSEQRTEEDKVWHNSRYSD